MTEYQVTVNKSFGNIYALENCVYYQKIGNIETDKCYICFKEKNFIKLVKKICLPEMKDNYIYINIDDRNYLDVKLDDKIKVMVVAKPETASSVLISVTDNVKKEVDTITDTMNTTIKKCLIQTVVNTNTDIGFLAKGRFNAHIVTILDSNEREINHGFIEKDTKIIFMNLEKKTLKLNITSINFEKIGIGGLEKEFTELVKSIFITRIIPNNLCKKLGIKHTKGAILYGPPGCGKSRTARQIGALIGCKNIRIINGPELLNKYVGESERNIRECFEVAKRNPEELYLLIFDEFDSIATRRSGSESSQHSDKLVGQLLTELDGVEEMNNIIVFALTNRLDIIDPAILRPGRFGVHIEIGLPDVQGRYEILKIHSKDLIENNLVEPDFDLMKIAELTDSFTGAELESLVQKTVHDCLGNKIDFNNIVESAKKIENISIGTDHFLLSLQALNPMFKNIKQKKSELLARIKKNFIESDNRIIKSIIEYIINKTYPVVVCICGRPKSGKTSIVCEIGIQINNMNNISPSSLPFVDESVIFNEIEYVSASEISKQKEAAKIDYLIELFAAKTPTLIILDNIEMIIEFVSEQIFNKNILHTIKCLLNETNHPVIITTSYYERLSRMTILDSVVHSEIIV